mmetsp:Transcript_107611/g.195759  ORF Transcript_107611/g.195759 Transcript_107611/m.195759 type:complete len:339 (-) Transcript_107611:432-1448(-)
MTSFEVCTESFNASFDVRSTPARLTVMTTGVTFTQTDQDKFFDFLGQVANSNIPFVSVFDLRKLGMVSPSQLRGLGEWCKAHEHQFIDLQLAIAILLTANFWSAAARRVIGVVTAICPPKCPLLTCHSLESAEKFLLENVDLGSGRGMSAPTRHVSKDSIGERLAPHEAVACPPRQSTDVLLPSRSFSRSLHCAHYMDLQDLNNDAILLTEEVEAGALETIADADQALEIVRVHTNALIISDDDEPNRTTDDSFAKPVFVSTRMILEEAAWAKNKKLSTRELGQLQHDISQLTAHQHKHQTCRKAASVSLSQRAKCLRMKIRRSKFMSHMFRKAQASK